MRFEKALIAATLALALHAAPAAAQSYWGQGSSDPTSGDCNPDIQQRQEDLTRQAIDQYTQMASTVYTPMPDGGFTGVSCLDRLLNSSFDFMFNPPSIEALLAMLANNVCQFATNLVREATSSALQSFSGAIPLGQIIPGISLGSLSGGMRIQPNIGGSGGGGPLNIMMSGSGGSEVRNYAGYWGGSPYAMPEYGSMFGTSGYSGFSGAAPATGSGGWFSGITSLFGR